MKRVALIVFGIVCPLIAFSQQDPQFSQYLFNGVVINPAYAGSKENINLNGLYRKQWVDVTGSPTSQVISVDAPLFNQHVGIGGYAYNDEAGAHFQKGAFVSFAYRIKVSSKGRLALGVAAGVNQVGLDGSKLTTDQPNDPAIPQERIDKVKPDLQAGIYYNTHRFFAGVSLADIITNNFDKTLVISERRHFYFSTGFVSSLSSSFKIRPSILVKEDFKGPTNADFTAFLIFKDRIWAGSSYRTRIVNKGNMEENLYSKDALVFMLQVFPLENLRVGYAYDLSLTDYKDYATHEISLGYMLYGKKGSKMLSPRYF